MVAVGPPPGLPVAPPPCMALGCTGQHLEEGWCPRTLRQQTRHRWPPPLAHEATTTTARRWPHGSAREQRLCLTPPAGPVGKSACRPERGSGSRDRGQEEVREGPFRHMRFGPSTRRLGKQALSAALSSWGRASGCVFSARLPPDGLGAGRRVTGPRRHRGC